MKQDPEFFGDRELELVYIAKRLKEALRVEEILTAANIDYAVEADKYRGGVIFRSERVGAFFYVFPDVFDEAEGALKRAGFAVVERMPRPGSTVS